MVEKLNPASQTTGIEISTVKREEAESFIRNKMLWVVPTWVCNRDVKNSPCAICFAKDAMHHARNNGYQNAQGDLLQKARALTKLPWKEVIITGGEPTMNPQLLEATLYSISPERNVRIITNGDWTLKKEQREKVLSVLGFHPNVRVEISAHDPLEVFKRKIEELNSRVKLGVQIRDGEGLGPIEKTDNSKKLAFARSTEGLFVEVHKVLNLGQAATDQEQTGMSVSLNMRKLIGYSSRDRNVGTYLMPGPNGTRVVANHETPYLVFPTPADIVDPTDNPEQVVEKIINFYATPTKGISLNQIVSYAEAAFRNGIRIDFGEFFPSNVSINEEKLLVLRNLADMQYKVLSEKEGVSVEKIKGLVTHAIAENLASVILAGEGLSIVGKPFSCNVSWLVPMNLESFIRVIRENLLTRHGTPRQDRYKVWDSLGSTMYGECYSDFARLGDQLRALGISFNTVCDVYREIIKTGAPKKPYR